MSRDFARHGARIPVTTPPRRSADATPRPAGRFGLPAFWQSRLVFGIGRLLARLPYRVLLMLGSLLGAYSHFQRRSRRKVANRQLALCLPELSNAQRKRLLFANAQNYGIGAMERMIAWHWPVQRLRRELLNSVTGLEHLQRLQGEGRGVILLALHATTLEMGVNLLRLVHPADISYAGSDDPVLDAEQLRGRGRADLRSGTRMIEVNSVRAMLKNLREGRAVWYAPDRDYGVRSSVLAPYFGIPAPTVTGPSRYAQMSGAAVITYDCWRDDGGGYSLRFSAPLEGFPSDDEVADCTRINAWVEASVRAHPQQYRWGHKRFHVVK